MTASDELMAFVRDALTQGQSRSDVEDVLLRAGWTREQVGSALASYAPIDFPVPVPTPRAYLSARDAFVYLLLFTTLYVSAYSMGVLLFQFINLAFPDPAFTTPERYVRDGMRWALASLIVAFPVFLFVARGAARAVRADPGKRRSHIRRWLTYLTIFAAAAVLIGDVITLVYNVLGGELTVRFGLKALVIAILAGAIFGYYLSDIRRDEKAAGVPRTQGYLLSGIASAAVVAVAIGGLATIGSPGEERLRRLDVRRVEDLRRIERAANLYFTRQGRLPAALQDLPVEGGLDVARTDPAGTPYEYRATGESTYELCAGFDTGSGELSRSRTGDFWAHGAGRHCFQVEARTVH